ncbi:MAG TPA: ATP-binding protein [Pseudorhodoferax sp.]|nr:ATP-binding protein [Pseudorhodoferax sp.]
MPQPGSPQQPAQNGPQDAASEQLQRIFDTVPVALYELETFPDGSRRCTYASPRVREILGVEAAELLVDPEGRYRHCHPEDVERLRAAARERFQRGRAGLPYKAEETGRYLVDGRLRWVRLTARAAPPRADGVQAWMGYFEDVTARQEEELALRQAIAEQQAILKSATVGICFTRDGVIVRGNAQLDRIFGAAPGALVGLRAAALYEDPSHGLDFAAQSRERMLRGETVQREELLRRVDGSGCFWAHLSGRALHDDAVATGIVWMLEDITERRRAAHELLQAKERAEHAVQAKADFLATMRHEVRTPMNALRGMCHLLESSPLDAEQREHLRTLRKASDQLLRMVEDMLDFSRAGAGQLALAAVEFDLDPVLERLADAARARAQAKGLAVVLELASDLPTRLVGDPDRIAQLLQVYIDNALKFTAHGEIAIAATVAERGADRVLLRLAVRDTGIGVEPDLAVRLFRQFEQVDMSATRRHGGTGLGLALARQLAQRMGGDTGVQSTPGAGSTFWATLWLTPAAQQPPRRAKAAGPTTARTVAALGAEEAQSAARLRQRLRALLAQDDAQAGPLLARERSLLERAWPQQHRALAAHVEGFDFEAALQLLDSLPAPQAAP